MKEKVGKLANNPDLEADGKLKRWPAEFRRRSARLRKSSDNNEADWRERGSFESAGQQLGRRRITAAIRDLRSARALPRERR